MITIPKQFPPKMHTHVADMDSTEWVTLCGRDLLSVEKVANRVEDGDCPDCKEAR